MRKAEKVACKVQMCNVHNILLGVPQGERILQKTSITKYTGSTTESVANSSTSFYSYESFWVKMLKQYMVECQLLHCYEYFKVGCKW